MITKIYISIDEFRNKTKLPGFVLEKIYLQNKIDKDYYEIIIDLTKSKKAKNNESLGYDFYVDYNLKRNKIWDDLEECEERLEVGL